MRGFLHDFTALVAMTAFVGAACYGAAILDTLVTAWRAAQ